MWKQTISEGNEGYGIRTIKCECGNECDECDNSYNTETGTYTCVVCGRESPELCYMEFGESIGSVLTDIANRYMCDECNHSTTTRYHNGHVRQWCELHGYVKTHSL